jgi:ubiquinone/menaquinone biosynthesis C-methylase UbiE
MFKDDTFHYVRLLHFPSTQLNTKVLDEVYRVLKPGGSVTVRTGPGIRNTSFLEDFTELFSAVLMWDSTDYFGIKVPGA